jgi:drug/metabolite transporter (DMT)-like permease
MHLRIHLERRRLVSYLFMLLNTLVWGAALVVVKPSLDITTPYRFLLYRYLIAGAVGLPIFCHFIRKNPRLLGTLPKIAIIELIGTTVSLWLLYTGLQQTGAIEASLLSSSQPLFVTLGGIIILREKVEKNERIGLILAMLGTLVLVLLPLFNGMAVISGISLAGNAMVMVSVALNMVYFPLTKKYYAKIPKLFAGVASFYLGLISFFLLSWYEIGFSVSDLVNTTIQELTIPSVLLAGSYMAIFGSVIGYTAYLKGQDGIEASEASLFYYLQPLIYIPMGMMFLGEKVVPLQILALLLVIVGVLLAELRFRKIRRRSHR